MNCYTVVGFIAENREINSHTKLRYGKRDIFQLNENGVVKRIVCEIIINFNDHHMSLVLSTRIHLLHKSKMFSTYSITFPIVT